MSPVHPDRHTVCPGSILILRLILRTEAFQYSREPACFPFTAGSVPGRTLLPPHRPDDVNLVHYDSRDKRPYHAYHQGQKQRIHHEVEGYMGNRK